MSLFINVTCPECRFVAQANRNMAGQGARCPGCGTTFPIPRDAAEPAPAVHGGTNTSGNPPTTTPSATGLPSRRPNEALQNALVGIGLAVFLGVLILCIRAPSPTYSAYLPRRAPAVKELRPKPKKIDLATGLALSKNAAAIKATQVEVEKYFPGAELGDGRAELMETHGILTRWEIQFGKPPEVTSAITSNAGRSWRIELIAVRGDFVMRGEDGAWRRFDLRPPQ